MVIEMVVMITWCWFIIVKCINIQWKKNCVLSSQITPYMNTIKPCISKEKNRALNIVLHVTVLVTEKAQIKNNTRVTIM